MFQREAVVYCPDKAGVTANKEKLKYLVLKCLLSLHNSEGLCEFDVVHIYFIILSFCFMGYCELK